MLNYLFALQIKFFLSIDLFLHDIQFLLFILYNQIFAMCNILFIELWQNQFEIYQFECTKHLNAPQPVQSLVLRVESQYSPLISDRNTSIHSAHEGESEIQQFHNILHHIDKKYNLHQSFEASKTKLELLQFYYKGRGFIEANYKEEVLQWKVKHDYV